MTLRKLDVQMKKTETRLLPLTSPKNQFKTHLKTNTRHDATWIKHRENASGHLKAEELLTRPRSTVNKSKCGQTGFIRKFLYTDRINRVCLRNQDRGGTPSEQSRKAALHNHECARLCTPTTTEVHWHELPSSPQQQDLTSPNQSTAETCSRGDIARHTASTEGAHSHGPRRANHS